MNTDQQQFQAQIEAERLWHTAKLGTFVFVNQLLFLIVLVFCLWEVAAHKPLLLWATSLTTLNFFRMAVLWYFHTYKQELIDHIRHYQAIILVFALLTSGCWVVGLLLFMEPAQPGNVMIFYLSFYFEVLGGILVWISYLPAVVAITLPVYLVAGALLLTSGMKIFVVLSIMLFINAASSIAFSRRVTVVLTQALEFNFENTQLQKAFEEKSRLLGTVLENMSQGISLSEQDDRLLVWNRPFTHLLGEAGAKVAVDANLSALLHDANPPLQIDSEVTEYRLPSGQVYEIRQSQLRQGGRVLTYSDITDLIKREQALEAARKEAERANTAKTRFLAAASHDLRQPIHALGLFFAELSDRVYSPETAGLIGQVDDAINAINSMLNALLDVSKLDAGVVKPAIGLVALAELFSRLQTEFQPLALENGNQLHIRPTSVIVNTDAAMLERMLRNLIGNAIRYTHQGRILVTARSRGDAIAIQVWDTGIGIPKDQLEDIFTEFHQLHNPARDRQQGLGLGLAIVKRLAKLLRYEIKVTSRLGRGSCFALILPFARRDARMNNRVAQATPVGEADILAGREVLVVDDDVAVLQGMAGLLTRWGCQVTTATTPAEARQKLADRQQKLELLIIDYRLPEDVSGIALAGALQKQLGYPLAVLVITGDTEPKRLQEANASGYPLLHKPVQPAKLRSTLQYLVSKDSVEGH